MELVAVSPKATSTGASQLPQLTHAPGHFKGSSLASCSLASSRLGSRCISVTNSRGSMAGCPVGSPGSVLGNFSTAQCLPKPLKKQDRKLFYSAASSTTDRSAFPPGEDFDHFAREEGTPLASESAPPPRTSIRFTCPSVDGKAWRDAAEVTHGPEHHLRDAGFWQQIGGSLNATLSQTDAELFSDPFEGFADSIACLARNEEATVGRHLPTIGPALLHGPAPLYGAPRSSRQLAAAFRVDTACGRLLTEVEDDERVPEGPPELAAAVALGGWLALASPNGN
mmetsp:Transcript_84296/g.214584  ORF Transcript_84296/g.214584 Transcript_84296/m.214584 type:complete len:282 (-) Transcript_84296:200-1045(-)